MLSYAILGTGALGGFYGAKLQQAGLDVHFLLHRDYEHVQEQGLVIQSVTGDFTLPRVQAYRDVQQMPRCDVVIIALKTTQNPLLSQLLPAVVKPQSIVLVLQNGLGVEPEVAQILASQQQVEQFTIMGGLCFICSNKTAPGQIHHLDYGQITLGEYAPQYEPAGITSRMHQVAEDFQRANIPIALTPDLLQARWQKLVWNIPFNGLSVVLNATTAELMADASSRQLAQELMHEVTAAARAWQREIPDSFIQKMLDFTLKMKPYRTSMKIDYDEKRPLEVETMFGNPLRAAQAAGVCVPRIEMIYQQLKFLDQRN